VQSENPPLSVTSPNIEAIDLARRFGQVQAVRGLNLSAGEVAQPGIALYTILNLTHVKLNIYVPTDRIGQVKLGQAAQGSVDAYPGRLLIGKVTHIDHKAEFTPKNVQTQEERARTVFAVGISLDNRDGAL
jgi:HlyD family secretion protein